MEAEILLDPLSRAIGSMFRRPTVPLVFPMPFKARWPFWSPFVPVCLTVVLCQGRKVREVQTLEPWSVVIPNQAVDLVVELPMEFPVPQIGEDVEWQLKRT